jgi:hypothetical protein
MQTDNLFKILKTEIEYDLWKFVTYLIVVVTAYALNTKYYGIPELYLLSYTLMFISAFSMFLSTYNSWKGESRLAGIAKFPLDHASVWHIRTIRNILYMAFFLFFIMFFQLIFNLRAGLYDRLIMLFDNIGVAFSALFLYEIANDSSYIKAYRKINRKNNFINFDTNSQAFKNIKKIVSGLSLLGLLYGGLFLTIMNVRSIKHGDKLDPLFVILTTLALNILSFILYQFSKRIFLKRRTFIDHTT